MSDPRLLDGGSSSRGRRASTFSRWGVRALLLGLALAAGGCASAGTFTWFHDVPRAEWAAPVGEYVIAVGDTVSVLVYDQQNLSTRGKVRVDGRLALPMVGEVAVAGKPPRVLAAEIEGRLKEFIVTPRVIVNVEETRPTSVTFVGEITRPGLLTIEPGTTLLQAIGQAGGPAEFADDSRIFVLRQHPTFRRIRFTYDALVHNDGGAATFALLAGDVVVVE